MTKQREQSESAGEVVDPRLLAVHETMTKEANGFYSLTSTICSAFLGGAVICSDRFLSGSPLYGRIALVGGITGLTLCLALLCWVRWGNVESYRKYAEALRDQDIAKYDALSRAAKTERRKTSIALWAFSGGLLFFAVFAVERVLNQKQEESQPMSAPDSQHSKPLETRSLDATTLGRPTPRVPSESQPQPIEPKQESSPPKPKAK